MKKIIKTIAMIITVLIVSSSMCFSSTKADEEMGQAAINYYKPKLIGKALFQCSAILEASYDKATKVGSNIVYAYCFTPTICLDIWIDENGKCVTVGLSENY